MRSTALYIWVAILTLGSLLGSKPAQAQEWEYGVWLGFSNYFGDLNSHTSFEYIGPGTGFFTRLNLNDRFAVKGGFNYGRVGFADEASPDPFQQARNLSFSSNILEVTAQFEVNFFRYNKRKSHLNFTPYLLAGISGFYFNPKAELDGQKYALQPIGTEGQNTVDSHSGRYKRISYAIPVGGGFKYSFHPAWTVGLELGVRKTFTDYLDDVSGVYPMDVVAFGNVPNSVANALSDRSGEVGEPIGSPGKQRGLSSKNDDFMFFGLTLSYTVLKTKCPSPSGIQQW